MAFRPETWISPFQVWGLADIRLELFSYLLAFNCRTFLNSSFIEPSMERPPYRDPAH